MPAGIFDHDSQHFTLELDAAVQRHLEWMRRVLRCAVLRVAPGDDVTAADSHRR